MESCVIYCRKSDPSATSDDESFENQEDASRAYAQQRGYSVFKVYREAHSGADLVNRPLIWEAMADIKSGAAQVLVVRHYDRLSRDAQHSAVIEYMIEKDGGRVEAALEPVDPNDINAMMLKGFKRIVAQAERLGAVARMERGKVRRAERGDLMASASPLFGYRWADDEPGKRTAYIPDTDTSLIVVRIFNLAIAGNSLRAIARLLNAEGVLTPSQWNGQNGRLGRHREGSGWSPEQVRRVIADRTYTGEATAYRWQRVKSKNGKRSMAPRPADDSKRINLSVPALVDTATFDAANTAVQAREANGRPPIDQETSWLRMHVYCGVCGSRMGIKRTAGRAEDTGAKYACRNRKSNSVNGDACEGGDFSMRAHLLDGPVYEALAAVVARRTHLHKLLVDRLGTDKIRALAAMAESFQSQLTAKRDELETARRRARQTTDDDLSAQFMHDAENLNAEIHALETDYADAREQLDTFTSGQAWIDAALERVYAASTARLVYVSDGMPGLPTAEDIAALPYEVRRLLLAATGLRVEVFPVGYRPDGKRVTIGFSWTVEPSHTKCGTLQLSITLAELVA
jgi:DNA invertase Pin-like site-specific DNA recombinase